MSATDAVIRIATLDLGLSPFDWAFARERRAEIDEHFARLQQAKPAMWNGRVLLMHRHEIAGDVLRGHYFETDFASFVAWRDFGCPDAAIRNCFALGALQGSDGGYVMGVMGGHTVNAGRIYFPGGTPDPHDLDGTRVDLESSVRREVQEETGLDLSEVEIDPGWHLVPSGSMLALLKPMRARETTASLHARIVGNIVRQAEAELAGAVVVRGAADIQPVMPAFIQTFLRSLG